MKDYKVYGNENTNLKLSDRAQKAYSMTDPFIIREYCHENDVEDADGNIIDTEKTYTYYVSGFVDRVGLTAEDVNELLEALYELINA